MNKDLPGTGSSIFSIKIDKNYFTHPSLLMESQPDVTIVYEGPFKLVIKNEDILECQRMLDNNTIRKITMDVLDPHWKECYLYVKQADTHFEVYLWPTRWLTFKARKDGYYAQCSLYGLFTFLTDTKASIDEAYLDSRTRNWTL